MYVSMYMCMYVCLYVFMYVLCEVEVVSLNDNGTYHLGESLCYQIKLQRVKINLESTTLTTKKLQKIGKKIFHCT